MARGEGWDYLFVHREKGMFLNLCGYLLLWWTPGCHTPPFPREKKKEEIFSNLSFFLCGYLDIFGVNA